ncbi:MAG: DNA polymerase III subunit delta [Candidatus Limnocylindria bacterium]
MASDSSSTRTRTIFLLHGEDPFRTRLRLAELVRGLLAGEVSAPSDLAGQATADLGNALGLTRHDARVVPASAIAFGGQSQGLFETVDDRRVVVVDHAEALTDHAFIASFPPETALVLVSSEPLANPRRAGRASARTGGVAVPAGTLPAAVLAAGGRVERVGRLAPEALPGWIQSRARLHRVSLTPAAVQALGAVGPDTERLENELAKLSAYAAGETIDAPDVARLVSGAVEADVFALTRAVIQRRVPAAIAQLERLLTDGQAPQAILALLVWQFRVMLFASALRRDEDADRMAKAIRSSAGVIVRASAHARRVTRPEIARAYETLYATDLAMKTGRIDATTRAESDALALTLCVLDLCGVKSADVRDLVVGEPPRR